MQHLVNVVENQVLGMMEPEALVSLVVFTGVVSVYRFGRSEAGAAVAEVFPGAETLQEEVSLILFYCLNFLEGLRRKYCVYFLL